MIAFSLRFRVIKLLNDSVQRLLTPFALPLDKVALVLSDLWLSMWQMCRKLDKQTIVDTKLALESLPMGACNHVMVVTILYLFLVPFFPPTQQQMNVFFSFLNKAHLEVLQPFRATVRMLNMCHSITPKMSIPLSRWCGYQYPWLYPWLYTTTY